MMKLIFSLKPKNYTPILHDCTLCHLVISSLVIRKGNDYFQMTNDYFQNDFTRKTPY
jgi:hypothetical protein